MENNSLELIPGAIKESESLPTFNGVQTIWTSLPLCCTPPLSRCFLIQALLTWCEMWVWSPRLTNLPGTGAWLRRIVSICKSPPHLSPATPRTYSTFNILMISSKDFWNQHLYFSLFVALFQEQVGIESSTITINFIYWEYFVCSSRSSGTMKYEVFMTVCVHSGQLKTPW